MGAFHVKFKQKDNRKYLQMRGIFKGIKRGVNKKKKYIYIYIYIYQNERNIWTTCDSLQLLKGLKVFFLWAVKLNTVMFKRIKTNMHKKKINFRLINDFVLSLWSSALDREYEKIDMYM